MAKQLKRKLKRKIKIKKRKAKKRGRSAVTGKFVPLASTKADTARTVVETVKAGKKKR